jgi:LPXTG-motif cell wall-anchored protein
MWICRGIFVRGDTMDTTTLLIIVIVVLLLGGGGWYGRGRWF